MKETGPIPTETLARLYASQGHYEQAREVYEKLLERAPERTDWQQALSALEEKAAAGQTANGDAGPSRLAELIGEWIDLHLRVVCLKRLKEVGRAVGKRDGGGAGRGSGVRV